MEQARPVRLERGMRVAGREPPPGRLVPPAGGTEPTPAEPFAWAWIGVYPGSAGGATDPPGAAGLAGPPGVDGASVVVRSGPWASPDMAAQARETLAGAIVTLAGRDRWVADVLRAAAAGLPGDERDAVVPFEAQTTRNRTQRARRTPESPLRDAQRALNLVPPPGRQAPLPPGERTRSQSARLPGQRRQRAHPPVALTPREIEVLRHLAQLLSTEETAAAMFVSVNTVRTHIRSILRKLGVTRRNAAVRRARDLGLLEG